MKAKELYERCQELSSNAEFKEIRARIDNDDLVVGWLVATRKFVGMGILTDEERHELIKLAAHECARFNVLRNEGADDDV